MGSLKNQQKGVIKCVANDPFDSFDDEFKTGDKNLDPIIKDYLKWEKNHCNSDLVKTLIHKKDLNTLKNMFMERLEIVGGTIKGDMVPGFNGINDLMVIQIGQGLVKYLEDLNKDDLKLFGVVIGYDGRYNSKRYSELLANIFIGQTYPVRMFSKEVITSFVPYAVTLFECVAGIMISGGACPKTYNGIKIFTSNGCQIIPPTDEEIDATILTRLEPRAQSWDTDGLEYAKPCMLTDPYDEVLECYVELVSDSIINEYKAIASKSTNKFVFTALHGVTYEVFKKVVDNHCLMIEPVPSQINPDPTFPTTKNPNPEDPKSIKKAKNLAQTNKIKYVIAADPDGCRITFSQLGKDNITWKTFDGNELGALFGWWTLDQYKKRNEETLDLKNVYMIATTVSSKILRTMAREEKFNFVETLPGFRWIANKAYKLREKGKEVIFGFEEAYGYMFTDEILDKDGIIASIQIMTMVNYLTSKDLTLDDKLDQIYSQYGFHIYYGSYFNAANYDVIESIFNDLREYKDNVPEKPKNSCNCAPEPYEDATVKKRKGCSCNPPSSKFIKIYPRSVGEGKFEITHIRDITLGFDNSDPYRRLTVFPVQPNMQMITFEFINGIEATLRANSGDTKLRYCAEFITQKEDMGLRDGTRLLNEVIHKMIHDFINPSKNALSFPKD
ncbi:glucose 1,6-bisphosphate synthase-like [Onthophagus taurus]|uniref:glucose 1,6-bisphosphate synthase-like n=1 Tax=Onthophagus taurus TaxID=166361 RepID=UPI0039BDECE2